MGILRTWSIMMFMYVIGLSFGIHLGVWAAFPETIIVGILGSVVMCVGCIIFCIED